MNIKIVWRVADIPVGRYRSFERRGWPAAYLGDSNGPCLAKIICSDDYVPSAVKTGDHAELTVWIADYRKPEDPDAAKWCWRKLRKRAATLKEAKELVKEFYSVPANKCFLPGE